MSNMPSFADMAAETATSAEDALLAQHGRDYTKSPAHVCKCGRPFRRSQNLGLHLAAVRRQGDKLWLATFDAEDERLRHLTPEQLVDELGAARLRRRPATPS